jgi:hypothetical protein
MAGLLNFFSSQVPLLQEVRDVTLVSYFKTLHHGNVF